MTITDAPNAVQPNAPASPTGGRIVSSLADVAARLATWRLWIVNAAVFGVFAGVFFGSSAPFAIPRVEAACGQAPPDVRFSSSAADVSRFLGACGAVGRDAYRSLQVADLLYPLVFGLFMATSLALVMSRLAPGRRSLLALAVVPLIGSAFDYLENGCAWLALAAFPDPAATSSLLGLASAAKTLTFWTAGALLLGALGLLVISKGRRRVRPLAHGAGADASSEVR